MANLERGAAGQELLRSDDPADGGLDVWHVDDNRAYSNILSRALNLTPGIKCSQQFASAPPLFFALETLPPPHVILLDFKMPGMTGVEALPRIRQLAPNTAVLMLTTYPERAVEEAALAAGAKGFLEKNEPLINILEAIRKAKASVPPARTAPTPPVPGRAVAGVSFNAKA